MKPHQIRPEIVTATPDQFEAFIESVVKELIPNFAAGRRLGERDRLGIDLYQYDPASGRETIAVQAKTVEREVKERHVAAFKKEFEKYVRLGPPVDEYWLAINKPIMEKSDRAAIAEALQEIVTAGKARIVRLLDVDALILHLALLANDRLIAWSHDARLSLRAEYAKRLEIVSYIHDVPFILDEKRTNPSAVIAGEARKFLDTVPDKQAGSQRKPPRFLIKSGFGFGKTSTLHAIADAWIKQHGHALYVPAANLPVEAFVSSAGLTDAILKTILPEQSDPHPLCRKLLRDTLRSNLMKSRDWILLIDALDESEYWSSQNHLTSFWGSIAELGLPTVISVRDEIFQGRRMEITRSAKPSQTAPFLAIAELEDWTPELILRFLDLFAKRKDAPSPPAFTAFRERVAANEYTRYYGDIPRRPLFLGMLAEDAWSGADPERELHRLYGRYFRSKLDKDWYSGGVINRTVRNTKFANQFGYDETIERMLLAMQSLALVLFDRKESPYPEGVIGARELEASTREAFGSFENAEETLLLSMLKPLGRDSRTRERTFEFAHQSFQDWFTARGLVYEGRLEETQKTKNYAISIFGERMAEDQKQGLGWP